MSIKKRLAALALTIVVVFSSSNIVFAGSNTSPTETISHGAITAWTNVNIEVTWNSSLATTWIWADRSMPAGFLHAEAHIFCGMNGGLLAFSSSQNDVATTGMGVFTWTNNPFWSQRAMGAASLFAHGQWSPARFTHTSWVFPSDWRGLDEQVHDDFELESLRWLSEFETALQTGGVVRAVGINGATGWLHPQDLFPVELYHEAAGRRPSTPEEALLILERKAVAVENQRAKFAQNHGGFGISEEEARMQIYYLFANIYCDALITVIDQFPIYIGRSNVLYK